ncbi:MAG TPA: precorrin-6y C5,15-methyltransferase (decarboxylating) subunit CbiE, partial [Pirellulales bacterium]
MEQSDKVYIVGIGDDGLQSLTSHAQNLVRQADLLIGSESLLALVPTAESNGRAAAERVALGGNLDPIVELLRTRGNSRTVVLASGDPLFYGVARYLCNKLGKERFEVVPHVSSMQMAFARVKESWEEAYLSNVAARPIEVVVERIRSVEKAGLFTSEACPPSAVAKALLDRGIDYFFAYVCENLGSPDERVTQCELRELADSDFAPLNCLILVRKPHIPDRPNDALGRRLFGNPDDVFSQTKPKRGLLTPAEVRAIALAEMDLGPNSIVWDVGAGSGSVSVEAAQIAVLGQTFAIEMDPEDLGLIVSNSEKFQTSNLTPILGRAPEAWQNLPDPDSVFVGGTGRDVARLIELAYDRLRPGGRLVANVGSIENLSESHRVLMQRGADPKVWMLNLARGVYQFERIRFDAMNPTFLIAVVKP